MEKDFTTEERLIKADIFTATDLEQIRTKEITLEKIAKELSIFKNGIAKTILLEPATTSNGILKLSEKDFQQKAGFFDAHKSTLQLNKFVPASGAATRMFKFLSEFLNDFDIEKESINDYINRKKASSIYLDDCIE